MYFLDNNSGTPTMPALKTAQSTTPLWFTEGDGSKGISWPGQDWFNIVQAELLAILAAAGIKPEKGKLNQLALAIKATIGTEALLQKNYLSEIAKAGKEAQQKARDNLGLGKLAVKDSLGPGDVNAYSKQESDKRFVKQAGDTMTGPLTLPRLVYTGEVPTDGNNDLKRPDGFVLEQLGDQSKNYPLTQGKLGNLMTFKVNKYRHVQFAIGSGNTEFWLRSLREDSPDTLKNWARVYTTQYKPTAADTQAADMRNNFAARMGIARVLSGSNPPSSPGVWSVENCSWTPEKWGTLLCTTNKTDLSTVRGEGQFLHYFFLGHSSKLYVAVNVNNTGAGWQQLIGPAGGNLNGPVSSTSWLSAARLTAAYHTTTAGKAPEGGGMFSAQLDSKAAFYQANFDWDVTAGGYYVPLVKGRSNRKGQGYPTAVSFGYLLDGSGSFARPCIHARGDNNKDAVWQFNPNDNMLYAPGGIKAGGATLAADGNILGSRWGNKWLWDAIIEQVNGRVDWGAFGNRTHWWTDGERGWWKDENTGFIYQWTVGPWRKEDEQIDSVGFPMRFPNQCCTVNVGAQAQGDGINNDAVAVVYGWNQEICRVQMNKPAGQSSWWQPMRTIIFAIGR